MNTVARDFQNQFLFSLENGINENIIIMQLQFSIEYCAVFIKGGKEHQNFEGRKYRRKCGFELIFKMCFVVFDW